MFIVEGPRFTGKSVVLDTVRREIKRRRMGRTYMGRHLYYTQRWGGIVPEYFDHQYGYLAATQGPPLCERFMLSDLVYDKALEVQTCKKFTPHQQRMVARELNRQGSVMVVLRSNWKAVRARMDKLGLAIFSSSAEGRRKLDRTYRDELRDNLALGEHGGAFVSYLQLELHSVSTLCTELQFLIDTWRDRMRRSKQITTLAPNSWGFLWPRIVFVGEQTKASSRPFASVVGTGASVTFSKLLDLAEVPEGHCYYVNSYDAKGDRINANVFEALQPKKIVALGKRSAETLRALNVDHIEFRHPRWLHRNIGKLPHYAEKLAEVCR